MPGPGRKEKGEDKKCSNNEIMSLLADRINGGYQNNRQEEIEQVAESCKPLQERA